MNIKHIAVSFLLASVVALPTVAVYKHLMHEETAQEMCSRTVDIVANANGVVATETKDEMRNACLSVADTHSVLTSFTPADMQRQESDIQYGMAKSWSGAYGKEYTAIMQARIAGYEWAYYKVKKDR